MTSTRTAVAIHVLTLLATSEAPLTSEYIAGSVNTNAVVIRRLLASLREAKLVESQGGAKGGWRLVRAPEAITLRDVYRATEEPGLFRLHEGPNPLCPVGSTITRALGPHFARAEQGLEAALQQSTIADLLKETAGRRS